MAFIVDERVEEYAEEHTHRCGDLFERLEAETREKTTAPQMMVGRLEGGFLATLVRAERREADPRARHLHGLLVDLDGERAAPTTAGSSPATSTRTPRRSPAATWTRAGTATGSRSASARRSRRSRALDGPFDLVFIDADKPNYENYYEAVLPKLADNGLVIADNVLWSGRVVETDGDESTQAIKAFNEHVRKDSRVVSVMLTVRDGMTLVQKR